MDFNQLQILLEENSKQLELKKYDIDISNEDMNIVFDGIDGFNNLDYISCWFYKATKYLQNYSKNQFAFVSTNSITQGTQVSLLWSHLLNNDIEISFAHQSFKWTNNAKNNAGVVVVIIGLRNKKNTPKYIFNKEIKIQSKNINPYLIDADNIYIKDSKVNISNLPIMTYGSMPNDDGNLIISSEDRINIITENPDSEHLFKKFVGAVELVRGLEKYCLWIPDESLQNALQIPEIKKRIDKTRNFRLYSRREATNKLANSAHKFGEIRHKDTHAIVVPQTGSERRKYLPIGYVNKDTVVSNAARVVYNAEPWLLGILLSYIHMIWVRTVSGRLKTDMQYSNTLSYNTFPFPKISQTQKEKIEELVNIILDERDKEYLKTLAELYDPDKMPDGLKKAHEKLDLYIETIYRDKPFSSDEERLEHLFKLYEKMIKEENQK